MTNVAKSKAAKFRPDTLIGSVLVLLAVSVVQRSIGFGRGVLFCRWLDPESLGHWDMAYGFLMLAAPVAVLGLPGSFGRYLERFRQRGQLRTFLKRTCSWTGLFGAAAVTLLFWRQEEFAHLVFGDPAQRALVVLCAVTLAMVILHHFLEAVFAGLRVFRVVSAMHFVQSMLFAGISLTLLVLWRNDAWSIVAAYGAACSLSAIGVLAWSRRIDWDTSAREAADPHREFWPPLLRFAVWVWVSNVLSNLFTIIDRYMIVHYSGLPADNALSLVGHYHTSMLVPVLLVSVANLLTGAMTPHLSHDWEVGDRAGVANRIGFAFKLAALGMFVAGIAVLTVTPWLFHGVFAGKYDEGLSVLPWALAACIWFSLLLVSQTYVWCAEKTRQASLPLVIGLIGNVGLNLVLLPRLGLQGAVIATALATLLALAAQLFINRTLGMPVPVGILLASLTPFGLAFDGSVALASACVFALLVLMTPWYFISAERVQIAQQLRERCERLLPRAANPATSDA